MKRFCIRTTADDGVMRLWDQLKMKTKKKKKKKKKKQLKKR